MYAFTIDAAALTFTGATPRLGPTGADRVGGGVVVAARPRTTPASRFCMDDVGTDLPRAQLYQVPIVTPRSFTAFVRGR